MKSMHVHARGELGFLEMYVHPLAHECALGMLGGSGAVKDDG